MADKGKQNEEKKIKVLMVAPAPPMIGGQAIQAERLLKKFQEEPDIQVDLQPINPQFFTSLQKIKYVRTVVTSAKYIFDLLVKIPRYDVVHIFSASYYSFLLVPAPAVLITRLFGRKAILNYRSGEAADHLKNWKSAVPIVGLFDEIIAPSGYLVDVFSGFDLKSQAIFNFVDTELYSFRERKPLRPVFLSNRNFESHYNVSCTLRAFGLIQKNIPDAQLIVAGEGYERNKLHSLAKELNLRNIEFIGAVPAEKMSKVYDRADIYLNSPNIDNMPNSIIEAFSCGLPVVSTNAGGIPYIVEHEKTGLMVEKNDHEELAQAAMRLLKSEELADKIIIEARRECIRYSWEEVRSEWRNIYQKLASKKAHSARPEESNH